MRLYHFFIIAIAFVICLAAYSCFMSVHSFHGGIFSYEMLARQKAYHVQYILWAVPKVAKNISYGSSIRNGFALRMQLSVADYETFCQTNHIENKHQVQNFEYYDACEKNVIMVERGETGRWLAKHPVDFIYDLNTSMFFLSCYLNP